MSSMNVFGHIHLVCAKQSQIVPRMYRKKIQKYYSTDHSFAGDSVYVW